jgi:hypothetical protein
MNVGFDVTDLLPIRFSAFISYCRGNGTKMRQYNQLFVDLKKAYDCVGRELLYNILIVRM